MQIKRDVRARAAAAAVLLRLTQEELVAVRFSAARIDPPQQLHALQQMLRASKQHPMEGARLVLGEVGPISIDADKGEVSEWHMSERCVSCVAGPFALVDDQG